MYLFVLAILSCIATGKQAYLPRYRNSGEWRKGKTFVKAGDYDYWLRMRNKTKVEKPQGGCCSWDGSTCGQTTDYCNANQQNCEGNCQGKWINGGSGGDFTCGDACAHSNDGQCGNDCSDCRWCWPSGSSSSDPSADCMCQGGSPSGGGDASTTRYWDCNQPFCEPGRLPYPHDYKPFRMDDGRIFAHAAASDPVLQGHTACEKCYELKYGGTTFVVKVDNWCPCDANPPGCCEPHFDIAVPGMDYAPASASNVCQSADGTIRYDKGRQSCSHWPWEDGNECCNSVSYDQGLNDACNLFVGIGWDNPRVSFQETSCPY